LIFYYGGGGIKINDKAFLLLFLSFILVNYYLFLSVKSKSKKNIFLFFVIVSLLFCIEKFERLKYLRWNTSYVKISKSYFDVQLWAKKNTSPTALFMPEPHHYYGWRDFSERSSFGNLREWLYTSINYNPEKKVYLEGLKRANEFGIDIDHFNNGEIKNWADLSKKIESNIKNNYVNMKSEKISDICKRYDIDYFIVKKNQNNILDLYNNFSVAFQNECYVVFNSKYMKGSLEKNNLKLRLNTIYRNNFSNSLKDINNIKSFDKSFPPMRILGYRGDFKFTINNENIMRIKPTQTNSRDINIGFSKGQNGFIQNIPSGSDVYFSVEARFSGKVDSLSKIFIQDELSNYQEVNKNIYGQKWKKYLINKTIRVKAKKIDIGINWLPKSLSEWLEIRNIEILIKN
jgi:hypothetical protein